MPNYQKTANSLFKSEKVTSRPDSTTGTMRLVTRRGVPVMCAATPRKQNFDAECSKDVANELSGKQLNRMQQIEKEYLGTTTEQFQATRQRLHTTRPRILIKPAREVRSMRGTRTTYDEFFNTPRPKTGYVAPDNFKRPKRNQSHIKFPFNVEDGYKSDVWMTTNDLFYSQVPEEYPVGYMTNQGIAQMYQSVVKSGRLASGSNIYRRPSNGK